MNNHKEFCLNVVKQRLDSVEVGNFNRADDLFRTLSKKDPEFDMDRVYDLKNNETPNQILKRLRIKREFAIDSFLWLEEEAELQPEDIAKLCRDMEERSNMAGVGTDAKNHWEQGFRSACRTIRREIEKSEDTSETTTEND